MTPKKRQDAIETFRNSTPEAGCRVLILSNVGVVGLNLACANIMIILVRDFIIFRSSRGLSSEHACAGYNVVGTG